MERGITNHKRWFFNWFSTENLYCLHFSINDPVQCCAEKVILMKTFHLRYHKTRQISYQLLKFQIAFLIDLYASVFLQVGLMGLSTGEVMSRVLQYWFKEGGMCYCKKQGHGIQRRYFLRGGIFKFWNLVETKAT